MFLLFDNRPYPIKANPEWSGDAKQRVFKTYKESVFRKDSLTAEDGSFEYL